MEAKRTASIVRWVLLVCIAVMITSGCAGLQGSNRQGVVPEVRPGGLAGYLSPKKIPNSLSLIPAPPAKGSAALALDEEVSRKSFALRGTSRWTMATEDADLSFPQAAGTFSCALKAPVTEQTTPHLYLLMRRSFTDVVLSTYAAKDHYARTRPFVINKEPTCTPDKESRLMKNGSYPSGHTAIGWAWALILAEIAPEQSDAILARGRAFGQSRVICNVHWQSDVNEGRVVGAGTVARLHADPAFRADVEAARVELATVREKGLKPTRDCKAEAAAMALEPPQAP
ncbi:MAG: Major phosphate-irrepressible acid phosphatase precursor [Syntrophorhabdus sp. PtaB.Bin006]|nr:MAG: Major phosphate-irrepressible acid phosphatase precursor [Syntrophorhabdus sp. PtaB.Bin006]